MEIYVIYEKPRDYPDKYVVRVWEGYRPRKEVQLAPSLQEARKLIPKDKVLFSRHPQDDPVVVETWI